MKTRRDKYTEDSLKHGGLVSFRTAVILATLILLTHLMLLIGVKDKGVLLPVSDILLTVTSGLAAAGMLYAALHSSGRSRRAWMVLAAAQIANTFAESAWAVIEVIFHQNPFPSIADVGYLIFYPLFAAGIFLLPEVPFSPRERLKALLDAAIVVVSATLVFWVFMIAPVITSNEGITLELMVSAAYPFMDLILFFALMELLLRKLNSAERTPLLVLAFSMVIFLISDALFSIQTHQGTFISGGLLDIGWLASYLALGLAAVLRVSALPSDQAIASDSILSRGVEWIHYLPYLVIAAAYSLLIWGHNYSRFINYYVVAASVGLIIGLMFIRQKVTFMETNQLLAMTVSEIEVRKQAEEALRESEQEKAAILGGLKKVAVEYLDLQMRIVWVNTSVRESLDLPDDKMKGEYCYNIIEGIETPCSGCTALKALQTGQSQEGELVTPDGRTWLSRSSPVRDAKGNITGVVHVALNISGRKKAESALKESERRLASIIDFLPDATFVIDKEGRVISWNRAIEKMTGIRAEQILGKGNHEYALPFYGERRPILIDMVVRFDSTFKERYGNFKRLEDGTLVGEAYMPKLKDGGAYLLGSASALYDLDGNIWGAIESIRDITERKHAEEALQNSKEKAESATRAKSEFLANMSHEIRTPMNAVIGMTGLLLDENLTAEQKEYVETIRNSGDTLLAIINNILDLTKIEAQMVQLERQPFDLRDCIESSLDLVAADANKKGLDTTYTIQEYTPTVILGDPTRLSQILLNLLSNAVKFTENGGVAISVSSIRREGNNYEIHFAVKDTGIGIPKDKAGRLFQSFSQIDASTTRRYGGTGLGLAICKKLAEMMGGKIWVESEDGNGSTFHFTIQAEPTLCEPIDVGKAASWREFHYHGNVDADLRILLAEDNVVNQMVTQRMLSKFGCRADVVSNGIEVLQALGCRPYDVILMDVLMPEMDGLETTREIRQRWPKGPRIIAMTASALKGDREACLAAGMDGYISKPTKLAELKAALETFGHSVCE